MNTGTGQVYRGLTQIEAAKLRGEPIVEVSPRVARLVELGNRFERRRAAAKARRKKKA